MATKKNEEGLSLRFDDFVKLVRPDPNKTEPISLLHGYIGASTSDDKIRLYADASLAEYVDIVKADIVHAIANEEDPLGGSQLWVKQSAAVNYTASDSYAQGDMYNDYLGNMYSPSDTGSMAGGAATQLCTVQPTLLTRNVVCAPTKFICPTPNSKLIICTLPPKTSICPIITRGGCPHPSWVDACPSALGCTITTGTTVINPGRTVQFGADANAYGSGDMYNDYMQNNYEPQDFGGGAEAFGPATIINTSPVICHFGPSVLTFCPPKTLNLTCKSKWIICPPKTCFLGTRLFPTKVTLAGCPSDFCATDFTKYHTTIVTGGIRPQDEAAAYGTGDMYNDYMQNDYAGEMGAGAGAAQPLDTSGATNFCPPPTFNCVTGICMQPPTRLQPQCGGITKPWNPGCGITKPWMTQCQITTPFNSRCCITHLPTRCCNTKPWICYQPISLNPTLCQVQQG